MKRVAFYTLGCKLNFSETSAIARDFSRAGYQKCDFEEEADVYVINTCSVTDNADRKCRAMVRRALRKNHAAFIAIIGCYAQLRPEEIAAIPGVSIVLGASEKFNLVAHIGDWEAGKREAVHACEVMQVKDFRPAWSLGDRTRSFLKVQDGCDYFCAFCTIPMARGRSRSGRIDEVVASAREIGDRGVKEIVLTGVNIGDFGKDGNASFLDLIRALDTVENIERFRISSIEPNLLNEDIIDHVARSPRFVPHFHIPLQSGSDAILKSMRRKYDSALYRDRIGSIKSAMPEACIGIDVIVGFPGEDDRHFEETHAFLQEIDFSYLHVFPYSERPGTTALRIDHRVTGEEKQRRSKILMQLSDKRKQAFYKRHLGEIHAVLWEGEVENGFMSGFTENYIKVTHPYQSSKVNTIEHVILDGIGGNGLMMARIPDPVSV